MVASSIVRSGLETSNPPVTVKPPRTVTAPGGAIAIAAKKASGEYVPVRFRVPPGPTTGGDGLGAGAGGVLGAGGDGAFGVGCVGLLGAGCFG